MKRATLLLALLVALGGSGQVRAAGYDTPILYTARHMGMGGTAIGYVYDPSALFHNPAGLAHTRFLAVTADFSPIFGGITSSPEKHGIEVDSDPVFAPFFLGAASLRLTDWLTAGVAVYPVASSGADYTYENMAGKDVFDKTKLVFIEVAPGLAVNLPWNLRLGAAWRATLIQFERLQTKDDAPAYDMNLSGTNVLGFRVGLQWTPIPWIETGLVYRHKTVTEVSADDAVLIGAEYGKTSMEFTLPSKFGAGIKVDPPVIPLAFAFDAEYSLNSQNNKGAIKAAIAGKPEAAPLELPLPNYWHDSITLRAGVELDMLIKWRLGYVFDGQASNIQYPSAFGTPPSHTQSITAGAGVSLGIFEVNLAYAYRFGSVTITEEDFEGAEVCLTCSKAGDYDIQMHGLYVDASVYF